MIKGKKMNLLKTRRICCAVIALNLISMGNAIAATQHDDEIKAPIGCRDAGYQFDLKTLVLKPASVGERNSLYFVFNSLNKPVRLHHMRKDHEASKLHLNHTIQPRKWAVLSTCEKKLNYICTLEDGKTPYGKIVDCADSLKVCEFARVKFGLNNRGNHWLVNSSSKNGAVRSVVYYGIIPQ